MKNIYYKTCRFILSLFEKYPKIIYKNQDNLYDLMNYYKCHDINHGYEGILEYIDSTLLPKQIILDLYKDILFGDEEKDNEHFMEHINKKHELSLLLYYFKWYDWFVDIWIFRAYQDYWLDLHSELGSLIFCDISISDMEKINKLDLTREEIIDCFDSIKSYEPELYANDRKYLIDNLKQK